MFINTPKNGYHFNEEDIRKIEELKGAKYMGYWCTKRSDGSWNDQPVDVFYQPNPNTELGHKPYFGVFRQNEEIWITDATSAFSETIGGIITEDGEVLVSRYRHDYVTKEGGYMIDGGRDYLRSSLHPTISIEVKDGEFIFGGVY